MKKYGLQLRIPPAQQKQTSSKPPLRPPASAFKDDNDDEDDVEREISRQAAKTKALQKVEEQHKKALEEDPSVFDYDGVYDGMKEKIARPRIQDKTERKSKYIETLMQKAKEREREHEIIYEKKLLKERSKDDHLYADKEKFVTSAYKKKLAESEKWMEEERLRQIREEKDDITKKKDLSEFYFGLNKNIAFGGGGRLAEPTEPEVAADNNGALGLEIGTVTKSNKVDVKSEALYQSKSQTEHEAATSKAISEDTTTSSCQGRKIEEGNKDKEDDEPNQTEEHSNQAAEAYKRSDDAVAAARERFLARKRARVQSYK